MSSCQGADASARFIRCLQFHALLRTLGSARLHRSPRYFTARVTGLLDIRRRFLRTHYALHTAARTVPYRGQPTEGNMP